MRILPRLVLNYKGLVHDSQTDKKKRLTSTDLMPRTGKNSVWIVKTIFFKLKIQSFKEFPMETTS